ncbi:MAG: tripartite tricarboxylate transporter substrate binding protein [Rhodospirillales bacterium]|nr:tripartite tricarboxylate transporter substrate binding protein [Rhodospirillales bacterium]
MIKRIFGAALAATVIALPAVAEYPDKDIKLIVPYGAGGGTDTAARLIQPHLEKVLGSNLIVVNMPGAGGTIGATNFAQTKADGYTLAFLPAGTAVVQPHLRKLQYNESSFEPVCRTIQEPVAIMVGPESEYTTLDKLMAAAKAGKVSAAGSAPGSFPHIGAVLVQKNYDVKIKYVPHEGGAKSARSVLGGKVDMLVDNIGLAAKFGIKALAVLSDKRAKSMPDVPTIDELGGPPIRLSIWWGLFAPAGTSAAVLDKLASACAEAGTSSAYISSVKAANKTPNFLGAGKFKALFLEQYKANATLFQEIGLKKK